ncbi:hypothetical protein [Pedobacter gandavensis]|uniref:hypothetical protein n=1 Tax=Pedobacter gandavensis TaxID=2679963 RepID=UPI00292F8294|nr:hypothetical protein [Pedobacter gandavensis]
MNTKTPSLLPIPLEFKIACATYQLPIAELLQLFIDHASFYDSLSQKSDDLYRAATNTLLNYSISIRRESTKAFLKQRESILKYIQEIIRIAVTPEQAHSKKRKRCAPIVKKIYEAMDRSKTQNTSLLLEENISLELTMDYCLLCEIHNCTPEEYLQYFMSQISLPITHANIGLGRVVENQAMGFFYKSLDVGIKHPTNYAFQNLQLQFIDQIQELHLWLFIIRDYEKRVKKYQEVYYQYYQRVLAAI